jgi:hypothetical protein
MAARTIRRLSGIQELNKEEFVGHNHVLSLQSPERRGGEKETGWWKEKVH